MATQQKTTGLTYDDLLEMFPEEDNVRRELIDGELIVTASPATVRIAGPRKQVAEADDAITDPVDISGITDRHSFSTHAYVSDPLIQVVNPRPVQVTVIMERIPVTADAGTTQPK